jgi:hypothetical protein
MLEVLGIATPKADLDLIKQPLRAGEIDYKTRSGGKKGHN